MTAGEFSEVDHDLLADYLGGALDGTPEQAEVARLIAQDPSWAQAHALLAPALADVRADLLGWGAPVVQMPAGVADRIRAALDAADLPAVLPDDATDLPGSDAPDVEPEHADLPGSDHPAAVSPGSARPSLVPTQPLGGRRRPGGALRSGPDRNAATRPGRRRRRWARVAGPVALAAAAVVGLGALQLVRPNQGSDSAETALSDRGASTVAPYAQESQDGPAAAAASPERGLLAAGIPQRHSATDYTPQELAAAEPEPQISTFAGSAEPGASTESDRTTGLTDLNRLADPPALAACLTDVGAEHGAQPLVFEFVEFARFQGLPALVVRFSDASGTRWAWVSGPECGIPGSGSDSRYRTRVG
ncbi:hypothetical protein E0H26_24915 [Micromonospora zingiberis]|uniref:Uncharacterized protein n=1 Tax=Micromonospora zingiberis TaxID=2053011 RepID=A0A4R0G6I0_9ACTN|nr:hypothetical protein [Micromonospora zingiberis]TCB92036.1 hypothetical protein E0H26_24915 [Micromonospora zingiberis]